MPRLTTPQKRFLVRCLAAWDTPSQAAAALEKRFGVTITRQVAEGYDPTKPAGAELGEDLKVLFQEERKKCQADLDAVPIACKAARLRDMQRDLDELEERKAQVPQKAVGMLITITKEKREIREQAAKEVGGMFEKPKPEGEGQDNGQVLLDHFRAQLAKAWGDPDYYPDPEPGSVGAEMARGSGQEVADS